MRDAFERAANAPAVRALLAGATVAFAIEADSWRAAFGVTEGVVSTADSAPEPNFTLGADDATWSALLTPSPAAGEQSIVHLVRTGRVELRGDARAYARHLHLVRALLDAVRDSDGHGDRDAFVPGRPLAARGAYHRVTTSLGTSDVYVERCGSGPQVLAPATAGSDTSQWHGLMTESDVTERIELVTVDLPWHGKSSPTFGTPVGGYTLTPDTYTEFIVAVADAIGLERPILLGASMAGGAVVHAVATHPGRFAGAVSCQAGPRVRNRAVAELRATDVNTQLFVPEWTYGLMNPASPAEFRKRVWWGYSSGGFGLYAADIDSYLQWDIDAVADGLTPTSPHIAVLSGRYDTTVPPEASRELASRIPNSSFVEMPELGHFPHAEHPARFSTYLEPALGRVTATTPSAAV